MKKHTKDKIKRISSLILMVILLATWVIPSFTPALQVSAATGDETAIMQEISVREQLSQLEGITILDDGSVVREESAALIDLSAEDIISENEEMYFTEDGLNIRKSDVSEETIQAYEASKATEEAVSENEATTAEIPEVSTEATTEESSKAEAEYEKDEQAEVSTEAIEDISQAELDKMVADILGETEETTEETEEIEEEEEAEENTTADEEENASAVAVTLEDKTYGVKVEITKGAIPKEMKAEDIALVVRKLTEKEKTSYLELLGKTEEELVQALDITLIDKDTEEKIQPASGVSVTMTKVEDVKEDAVVYRIDSKKSYTELETNVEEKKEVVEFETNHFTPYIITSQAQAEAWIAASTTGRKTVVIPFYQRLFGASGDIKMESENYTLTNADRTEVWKAVGGKTATESAFNITIDRSSIPSGSVINIETQFDPQLTPSGTSAAQGRPGTTTWRVVKKNSNGTFTDVTSQFLINKDSKGVVASVVTRQLIDDGVYAVVEVGASEGYTGVNVGDDDDDYSYYRMYFDTGSNGTSIPAYCINKYSLEPGRGADIQYDKVANVSPNELEKYLSKGIWTSNDSQYIYMPYTHSTFMGLVQLRNSADMYIRLTQTYYLGYPYDKSGLQAKYRLSDKEYFFVTQHVSHEFSDYMSALNQSNSRRFPTYLDGLKTQNEKNAATELYELVKNARKAPENVILHVYTPKRTGNNYINQNGYYAGTGNRENNPGYQSLYSVEIEEQPEEPVKVYKVAGSGSNVTGLKGAELTITNKVTGEIVATWISDGNEKELNLAAGTYVLKETKAPRGYVAVKDITFVVYSDGTIGVESSKEASTDNNDKRLVVTDLPDNPTDVKISKVEVNGTKELPGAKLTIREGEGTKGTVVETWTSTNEQRTVTLSPGTYTLVEEKAPNGYLVAEPIVFKVTEDNKVQIKQPNGSWKSADNNMVRMEDPVDDETEYTVEKRWLAGTTPEPVKVQLYKDSKPANVSDAEVTLSEANNWTYRWTGLKNDGKYTVREINPPEGTTPYYNDVVKVKEGKKGWSKTDSLPVNEELILVNVWSDGKPYPLYAKYKNSIYVAEFTDNPVSETSFATLGDEYKWIVREYNGEKYLVSKSLNKAVRIDSGNNMRIDVDKYPDEAAYMTFTNKQFTFDDRKLNNVIDVYAYTAEVTEDTEYIPDESFKAEEGKTVIQNRPSNPSEETDIDVSVKKTWDSNIQDSEKGTIEVQLYRREKGTDDEGEAVGKPVPLDGKVDANETTPWYYKWTNLDKSYDYYVKEVENDKWVTTVKEDAETVTTIRKDPVTLPSESYETRDRYRRLSDGTLWALCINALRTDPSNYLNTKLPYIKHEAADFNLVQKNTDSTLTQANFQRIKRIIYHYYNTYAKGKTTLDKNVFDGMQHVIWTITDSRYSADSYIRMYYDATGNSSGDNLKSSQKYFQEFFKVSLNIDPTVSMTSAEALNYLKGTRKPIGSMLRDLDEKINRELVLTLYEYAGSGSGNNRYQNLLTGVALESGESEHITRNFTMNNSKKYENPEGKLVTEVSVGDEKSTKTQSIIIKISEGEKVTVTDTISYEGLVSGKSYTVTGKLYEIKADGTVDENAPVATIDSVEKVASETGKGNWTMEFKDVLLEAGKKYVVYETAVSVENLIDSEPYDNIPDAPQIVEHTDPKDKAQTIVTEEKPKEIDVDVQKSWSDKFKDSEKVVDVELMQDGVVVSGSRVTLNAENNWYHKWTGLSPDSTYRVQEIIPEGKENEWIPTYGEKTIITDEKNYKVGSGSRKMSAEGEKDSVSSWALCINNTYHDPNGNNANYTRYDGASYDKVKELVNGTTLSEEDFMRLKRMLYYYIDQYENGKKKSSSNVFSNFQRVSWSITDPTEVYGKNMAKYLMDSGATYDLIAEFYMVSQGYDPAYLDNGVSRADLVKLHNGTGTIDSKYAYKVSDTFINNSLVLTAYETNDVNATDKKKVQNLLSAKISKEGENSILTKHLTIHNDKNETKVELPDTGGMGRKILYIAGIALVAVFVIIFGLKKKADKKTSKKK